MSARRKQCHVGLLVVAVLVGTLLLAACGSSNALVGRWQDDDSPTVVEFTNDGKLIVSESGFSAEGTYEIVDASHVTLYAQGESVSAEYSISGDTLTLISEAGDTEVMTRIK